MGLDRTLVLGMNKNLQKVLYDGLHIEGEEAYERCRELLNEPPELSQRRDELTNRQERLRRARAELVDALAIV